MLWDAVFMPVFLIGGGTLISHGFVGRRVGKMRVCNRCEYILAEDESATQCTECGLLLEGHPVVRGQRRRRTAWIAIGLVLSAIWVLDNVRKLYGGNVQKHLPTSVLLWSTDADDFLLPTELLSRIKSASLNAEDIGDVVEAGLAIQADASRPGRYRQLWIDCLEAIDARNGMTEDQQRRYYEQGVKLGSIDAPAEIIAFERFEIEVGVTCALPTTGLFAKVENHVIEIDGRAAEENAFRDTSPSCRRVGDEQARCALKEQLPVGPHKVRYAAALVLSRGNVISRLPIEREFHLKVQPIPEIDESRLFAEAPTITAAQLLGVLKHEIRVKKLSRPDSRATSTHQVVAFRTHGKPLPIAIAFDVVAVWDGGSTTIATVAGRKGDNVLHRTWPGVSKWYEHSDVRVILRPSRDVAARYGLMRIYPHEISLGRVTVEEITG